LAHEGRRRGASQARLISGGMPPAS
jgi:hypothetical protein